MLSRVFMAVSGNGSVRLVLPRPLLQSENPPLLHTTFFEQMHHFLILLRKQCTWGERPALEIVLGEMLDEEPYMQRGDGCCT